MQWQQHLITGSHRALNCAYHRTCSITLPAWLHTLLCFARVSVRQLLLPLLRCFLHADTIVDVPAEREVSVHIENGTSYTVTLYSGRLDVKALKESMADEGLVLRTLNGVVPAYDANGMSRTVYHADILGKTKAKTGEARPPSWCCQLLSPAFSPLHKV